MTFATSNRSLQSVSGYRWLLNAVEERDCLAMTQALGLPDVMARILCGRGIALEQAPYFLKPTLREALPDPLHLLDMEKAAARTARAITAGEKIAVFGDYDVDGATSSALLIRFFHSLGAEVLVYIPDRIAEGYGPNANALLTLKQAGASVVITVDCGTVAFEPLAVAKQAGLDIIVLDHHQGEAQLPDAYAVVNPNRLDETSEHRTLAAVGVTFLFAVALNRLLRTQGFYSSYPHPTTHPVIRSANDLDSSHQGGGLSIESSPLRGEDGERTARAGGGVIKEPDLMQWLDLVALGTICDVVPLTGLNRALVAQGLKVMAARRNTGIAALMHVARLNDAPIAYHAGFVLGPRINAGGRIGKSNLGVRLLATENPEEAFDIAQQLDRLNAERKAIELMALEEAMLQAERQSNRPMLLVASESWHPGVIGIIASRLKDKFHKPTAVLALDKEIGKASLRSVAGFDIGVAVTAARQQGLLLAGGGHTMAAGFTVARDGIDALHEFLCDCAEKILRGTDMERRLRLDGMLHVGGATLELVKTLAQAGPFGAGNSHVRLAVPNAKIVRADRVGENHVRCVVIDAAPGARSSSRLACIAFRAMGTPLGDTLLAHREPLALAGTLSLNRWNGTETVQMQIEDAAL